MSVEIDVDKLTNHMVNAVSRDGLIDSWIYRDINRMMKIGCESPIEALLGAALVFVDRFEGISCDPLILARQGEIPEWRALDAACRLLVPQFKIDDFRIDWAFCDGSLTTFIECDGHDFHDRTKQQAARDKSRDRILQSRGPVLRFTGSEIWADPFHCAYQIFEFAGNRHLPAELREGA